jgi:precorrin-6B methylase 2
MSKTAYELAEGFGYMTKDEVWALKRTVRTIEYGQPVLVNIGAGAGTSTLAMREEKPAAELYSIDKSPGGPLGGLEGELNAFKDTDDDYFPPIQILRESHKAAVEWADSGMPKIDLIFIDDGHAEPEIRGDIEYWLHNMKQGSYMVFHDYGSERWPAVQFVVDELMSLNKFHMVSLVDTVAVFRVE